MMGMVVAMMICFLMLGTSRLSMSFTVHHMAQTYNQDNQCIVIHIHAHLITFKHDGGRLFESLECPWWDLNLGAQS